MDIQDLRKQPHLSASSIRTYLDCGLQYRFRYIDRLPPEFIAAELVLGKAVHRTLEWYNGQRLLCDVTNEDALTDRFTGFWKESLMSSIPVAYNGDDEKTLCAQGMDLISVFLRNLKQSGQTVLSTEQPFVLTIPEVPIPVIGVKDLIEDDNGAISITEYKTAKRAYSTDQVRQNLQLTLYWMAAQHNGFQDREIMLRIGCLIKTKTPRYEEYITVRSADDETRLIRKITEVYRGMQAGIFLPNDGSWLCARCPYQTACQHWFNNETGGVSCMA